MKFIATAVSVAIALISSTAFAADYPAPIPASTQTCGHSTTGNASFYAQPLRELLQTAPQRTM